MTAGHIKGDEKVLVEFNQFWTYNGRDFEKGDTALVDAGYSRVLFNNGAASPANAPNVEAPERLARRDVRFEVARSAKSRYRVFRDKHTGFKPRECALMAKVGEGGELIPREVFGRLIHPKTKRLEGEASSALERAADIIHGELDKSSAFARLQTTTKHNPIAAAVAAVELADWIVEDIDLPAQPKDSDVKRHKAQGASDTEARQAAIEDALASWCKKVEGDRGRAAAMRGSLDERSGAAGEAAREVCEGLARGFGMGDADDFARTNPDIAVEIAEKFANDARFRRVLKYLGAFSRAFSAASRTKKVQGQTEPWSVTTGDDVRALLPAEKARLALDATRLDTMRRFLNRETFQFKLRTSNPSKRGPFRLLVDASGSMHGRRIETATAFAAAALIAASDEGREVALTLFASRPVEIEVDVSTPEARLRTLERILSVRAGGGTNIGAAFAHITKRGASNPDADVLLLSDGMVSGDARTVEVAELALAKADLHYIVIGPPSAVTPWLREKATRTIVADDLRADDGRVADAVAQATRAS